MLTDSAVGILLIMSCLYLDQTTSNSSFVMGLICTSVFQLFLYIIMNEYIDIVWFYTIKSAAV